MHAIYKRQTNLINKVNKVESSFSFLKLRTEYATLIRNAILSRAFILQKVSVGQSTVNIKEYANIAYIHEGLRYSSRDIGFENRLTIDLNNSNGIATSNVADESSFQILNSPPSMVHFCNLVCMHLGHTYMLTTCSPRHLASRQLPSVHE